MKKYNWETKIRYGYRRRRRKRTRINTKYNICFDNNNINVKYIEEHEWKFWGAKTNNTTKKEKTANVNQIKYIKINKGKEYKNIFHILLGLFIVLFIVLFLSSVKLGDINIFSKTIEIFSTSSIFSLMLIPILTFGIILEGVPNKEMIIKFIDDDEITVKYSVFEGLKEINDFINDLKTIAPDIKIINANRRTNIIYLLLIVATLLIILLSLYIKNEEKEYDLKENNLKTMIKEDLIYEKVEIEEVNYIKRDYILNYNVFEIAKSKEKIYVKEDVKRKQKEYNMFIIKYYSKENEKIIFTAYEILNKDWVNTSFEKYNKRYHYMNNKIYIFSSEISKVDFWDKETHKYKNLRLLNEKTLYDFIKSGKESDIIENNLYNNYKYISSYNTVYGKAYIVQATIDQIEDYLVYIQIKDEIYDAIIIQENNIANENPEKYFKSILSEI